jgi:hypothetical protein
VSYGTVQTTDDAVNNICFEALAKDVTIDVSGNDVSVTGVATTTIK